MDKPTIIGGIDITKRYPIAEIMEMHAQGKLRNIGGSGYIVRADADGMVGFVPWTESTLFRMNTDQPQLYQSPDFTEAMRQDVETEHPMRRRTPQERVASMLVRMMGHARETNTVPGLTEKQISTITGESWKEGDPLPAESVRAVAAHFLGIAEKQNKEADSHRTTRSHQFA